MKAFTHFAESDRRSKVEGVHTDNSFEFTNRLNSMKDGPTIFAKLLGVRNIKYKG